MQFHALREEVIACLALVEALIDFGEGEEIEEGVLAQGMSRSFILLPGGKGRAGSTAYLGALAHSTGASTAFEGQDTVDIVGQSARRNTARRHPPCDLRPAECGQEQFAELPRYEMLRCADAAAAVGYR